MTKEQPQLYIASSWKNVHAVKMLTEKLRAAGFKVASFVENAYEENLFPAGKFDFDEWIASDLGQKAFEYDTDGARLSDAIVYLSPSGCDAWAEVGIAWGSHVPVFGLHAKGEQVGLMRRLVVEWFKDHNELIAALQLFFHLIPAPEGAEG